MNEDQFEREKLYQATMNMFQGMLKAGVITEEQYAIIDTKMLQKYQPLLGTLFAAQPLTKWPFRVMYSSGKELIL